MFLSRNLPKLKAKLHSLIGKRVTRCTEHTRADPIAVAQEAGLTDLPNDLEGRFYGRKAGLTLRHIQKHLYTLSDVWLVAKEGHVFFDDHTAFDVCYTLDTFKDARVRRPVQAFAHRLTDPVIHLMGHCPENRAHFIVEQIPRLLATLNALPPSCRYTILLSPGHLSWQRPLLEKLGISPDTCIEGIKGTVFCLQLHYTPLLGNDRSHPVARPEHYRSIRASVLRNTPRTDAWKDKIIFISRKDAPDRFLLNEDEVIRLVQEVLGDTEVVKLTRMSLDEKVNLFRNARAVIGPHGQGFRNALFADGNLMLQLFHGTAEDSPEIRAWRDIFSAFGGMAGADALTLYSDTHLNKNGDWLYPADTLRAQLVKLKSLRSWE
jgi:prepilin-type processing-associated H-X9-DG protein